MKFSWWHVAVAGIAALGMAGCNRAPASRPVIALLTDYGTQDPYLGQLKGAILSVNPDARIVDVTHDIEPFGLRGGAFVLDQVAAEFPKGTLFVGLVAPGVGPGNDPLLIRTKQGHFFLGPDNGLVTLLLEREDLEAAWVLDKPEFWRHGSAQAVSHGRDVFGPVAAHLAAGVAPDRLGTPTKKIQRLAFIPPQIMGAVLAGEVMRVDRFGNVITNIPENFSPLLKKGTLLKLTLGATALSVPLVESYDQIPDGRSGLIFNSAGLLQISLNRGSAARQLKVTEGAQLNLRR